MPLTSVVELAHVQVSFFSSVVRVRWMVADLNRHPLGHESPGGPSSKVAEEDKGCAVLPQVAGYTGLSE
mgnify:CR=1 FL=1